MMHKHLVPAQPVLTPGYHTPLFCHAPLASYSDVQGTIFGISHCNFQAFPNAQQARRAANTLSLPFSFSEQHAKARGGLYIAGTLCISA